MSHSVRRFHDLTGRLLRWEAGYDWMIFTHRHLHSLGHANATALSGLYSWSMYLRALHSPDLSIDRSRHPIPLFILTQGGYSSHF